MKNEFKDMIDSELANELLGGGTIIDNIILESENKGYILIMYSEPKKEIGGDRFFSYATYELMKFSDGNYRFYKAVQFVKMSKRQAMKLAAKHFWN